MPADLGGGGATHAEMCAALAGLAAGCPATALTLSMHAHLVAAQVWNHRRGTPAPALAKVAGGAYLVSTGASDWLSSNGSARRTAADDGWILDAVKRPASGALAGDLLITTVRHEAGPDGPEVLHLAVPFSAAGLRVEETWQASGMRGTGSHTVHLVGVEVPDSAVALRRPADAWHPAWAVVLGAALPLILSVYVGVADAAVELAIGELRGRPHVDRAVLGRMLRTRGVARDAVAAMLRTADDLRFEPTPDLAAGALGRKVTATEAAISTVDLAVELVGGRAYERGHPLERLARDVRAARHHPLPSGPAEEFIARVSLGSSPV